MKKIGLIILAVVILGSILVLTLVMEVLEFFAGAIFFVLAAILFIYLFNKVKNKLT